MIKIRFKESRSKQFSSILKTAKTLQGYHFSEGYHCLSLSYSDVFSNWEAFNILFCGTRNWKSFDLHVDDILIIGKEVSRFYYAIQDVKICYRSYLVYPEKENYCNSFDWKCSRLNRIKTKPKEWGTFWYSFGHFSHDYKKWIIDKERLRVHLENEMTEKHLTSCPIFSKEKLLSVINSYPAEIDLSDTKNWMIITEKRFIGTEIKDVPITISHRIDDEIINDNQIISINPRILFGAEFKNEREISPGASDVNTGDVNPFEEGTDDWANWEIDKHTKRKSP
jgi:hypothetical protein